MPLSDEELRLLEQMERAMEAEDPRFASTLRGTFTRRARLRVVAGLAVFVGGVSMLVVGAMLAMYWLAIAGFGVMVVAGTAVVAGWRTSALRMPTPRQPAADHPSFQVIQGGRVHKPTGRQSALMHRLEERWMRRRQRWS